jgi:hypothetical protein
VTNTAGTGILIHLAPDVTVRENTVVGPGTTAAPGSGPTGIRFQSRHGGRIIDNSVSKHHDPASGFGCGIVIGASAVAVELSGNTFPAPGNEVDLCDERLPVATPIP